MWHFTRNQWKSYQCAHFSLQETPEYVAYVAKDPVNGRGIVKKDQCVSDDAMRDKHSVIEMRPFFQMIERKRRFLSIELGG